MSTGLDSRTIAERTEGWGAVKKTKRKQIEDKRDACQDMRAADRSSRQSASIDSRLSLTCLWSECLRSYGNY